jgi:hypothetical protein
MTRTETSTLGFKTKGKEPSMFQNQKMFAISIRSMLVNACATMTFLGSLAVPLAYAAEGDGNALSDKLQPYIKCINSLSESSFSSQDRYFSWAGNEAEPNTKAKVVYGLYTISDSADCAKGVEEANAAEPHNADLEAAGTAYAKAAQVLEPLLKSADDYYEQENYKDDKFAKAKEMHTQLLAAYDEFGKADSGLRAVVQKINDDIQLANLAEIEKTEGRNAHFLLETLMLKAKTVVRSEGDVAMSKMDLAVVTEDVASLEAAVKELETYMEGHADEKIGIMILSQSKSLLVTAKGLMRRVRDKVEFSEGEKMTMEDSLGAWMVEGSQPRLTRDYNTLVSSYNSGI